MYNVGTESIESHLSLSSFKFNDNIHFNSSNSSFPINRGAGGKDKLLLQQIFFNTLFGLTSYSLSLLFSPILK